MEKRRFHTDDPFGDEAGEILRFCNIKVSGKLIKPVTNAFKHSIGHEFSYVRFVKTCSKKLGGFCYTTGVIYYFFCNFGFGHCAITFFLQNVQID